MTRTYPAVSPTLDYATAASSSAANPPARSMTRIAWLVCAAPALVVPFVNFTFSTTPLEAVSDPPGWNRSGDWMIFLLGSGFFAGIPVVAWWLRRACWNATPRRWELVALWVVSLLGVAPACGVAAIMLHESTTHVAAATQPSDVDTDGLLYTAAVVVPLVIGVVLAVRRRWRGRRVVATESLLLTGYVANAAICLLGFHEDPNLGYWMTIPPTIVFAWNLLRPDK